MATHCRIRVSRKSKRDKEENARVLTMDACTCCASPRPRPPLKRSHNPLGIAIAESKEITPTEHADHTEVNLISDI